MTERGSGSLDEREELRRLAEAATPGPWVHDGIDAFDEFPSEWEAVIDGPDGLLATFPTGIFQEEHDHYNERTTAKARASQAFRDAAYIAAVSPDVVLRLLDAAKAVLDWEEKERWAGPHDALAALIGYYE